MIREILKETIRAALSKLSIEDVEVELEHPADLEHGDFATNCALVLAKKTNKQPHELAKEIVRCIKNNSREETEKIEVAGPGFINFHLSKKYFSESIRQVLDMNEAWGKNISGKGTKVMVEYTDPNPFKVFHIGHLMSNTIGESIARLIEYSGADTKRANYQGDVGPHVAKAIYGMQHGAMNGTIEGLGKAYAMGSEANEKDEKAKEEITRINQKVYEQTDNDINRLYQKGRALSLDHFEDIYKKLGTKFDYYFFESDVWKKGLEIVREFTPRVFEESDGAIVFRGEKRDQTLHTRVFITKEHLPTYEAKEMGLILFKTKEYDFDTSITITGNEQKEYFRVVKKAMEEVYPNLAEKIEHISHGFLRLPGGKMSSRTGDVISAESLLHTVQNEVLTIMKNREIAHKDETASCITIGALKYSILKQTIGKDIIFELDKALSFEGDSGVYLQYAGVRAASILKRAKEEGLDNSLLNAYPSEDWETTKLEKLIYRVPEIVQRAQQRQEPHYITTYLTELAAAYNALYVSVRIFDTEDDPSYKLALTQAFHQTMQSGLWLLGIQMPEKM